MRYDSLAKKKIKVKELSSNNYGTVSRDSFVLLLIAKYCNAPAFGLSVRV